jgi:hypothetical protein
MFAASQPYKMQSLANYHGIEIIDQSKEMNIEDLDIQSQLEKELENSDAQVT